MADGSDLRNISDTARWVAWYRALESERTDAWFRDPMARRLAGERGERIASEMGFASQNAWSFVSRTVVIDRYIEQCIADGATLVVNLAAGLDTRPYRMSLPSTLRWVEVDLPDMLAYKRDVLGGEHPTCDLEHVPIDLANREARQRMFADLAGPKALVITEGLVVYLSEEEVGVLSTDLARTPGFSWWALDMVSPRLMAQLQRSFGGRLAHAGAPLKFAPREGPHFFTRYGWRPAEVRSLLHTAKSLHRLPLWLRLIATVIPDSQGLKPDQPWGGVCLFERR